jgi:hypothetical protein
MLFSRPRHFMLILTATLIFYSLYKYLTPRRRGLGYHYLSHWGKFSSPAPPLDSVSDIFDRPPVVSEAIQSVCAATKWNSNLIFTCNNSGGGVGNLRNSILNCVRYAIHAGAGMTLPMVIERDPADIAHIWERERVGFDLLFDVSHFVESLGVSCPQLRLFNGTSDLPSHKDVQPVPLEPEKIGGPMTPEGLQYPEQWRGYFYKWLANNTDVSHPVVIDLGRSYLQYPIYTDPERFALDFGRILKFRADARILATTVLKNMIKRYDMHVDPWAPIWKKSFFGAHLRTESDSQRGWPVQQYEYSRYSTQARNYLEQAINSSSSLIYLASGDQKEIMTFMADARAMNLTVTTKDDLLSGDDLTKLQSFSFDQRALVDFLVLLKSQDFAGVGHSSFAWNIALWRHVFAEQREHLKGPQLMSDELSQIYGTVNQYMEYAACLWP